MILKFTIVADLLLMLFLFSVLVMGSLDKENRILHEIKNNHRINLSLYDSQTMKFEQDIFTERARKTNIKTKLPNIKIALINIPTNAKNINSILSLPSFISLGFKRNANNRLLNISSYSGHKTIKEIYVMDDCQKNSDSCICLNKSDSENILIINKLISSDYLNGLYINAKDISKLSDRKLLLSKIINSGAILIGEENTCYKERICNFNTFKDKAFVGDALMKVLELSKKDLWLITFEYNPTIVEDIYEFLSKYHDI